ncbi:MAG: threonylcarbamoyl-AMP synthase [Anaerolineales bacterium]|nr:threonylcarbamoyl-AMP synthase [Anaerolineales bacterium]
MNTQRIDATDPVAIPAALNVLAAGGAVAFPTDTVYGLGALAFDPAGIARLYAVKDRAQTKAIALLLGGAGDLPQVAAAVSPAAQRLAERFWPGPLTLVLPRRSELPAELSPNDTIGLRVPDHPAALALLAAAGPLAVTSANLSGGADTLDADAVLAQLGGRIELVLDGGPAPGGQPSTVVDLSEPAPRILRPGPLSEAEILAALEA